MIGQCGYCGGWHTSPEPCPAIPHNAGASQPLGDWRDAEIERLRRELAEARGLLMEFRSRYRGQIANDGTYPSHLFAAMEVPR